MGRAHHLAHSRAKQLGILLIQQIPYSGFLLRVKTFVNCLKIDFREENFRGFTVSQFATPINTASEGQCRVLPLYGSAVLDRSNTGFASLLAALIVETGTTINSGPSGFVRTESAP